MRRYTEETLKYIMLFEDITRARVKDCFMSRALVFIVEEGEAGKAIGKKGVNIKKISGLLKKHIKVVEFNKDPEKFLVNFILPLKGNIYKLEDKEITIKMSGRADKAALLGKNRQNLKKIQEIMSRYFDVKIMVA